MSVREVRLPPYWRDYNATEIGYIPIPDHRPETAKVASTYIGIGGHQISTVQVTNAKVVEEDPGCCIMLKYHLVVTYSEDIGPRKKTFTFDDYARAQAICSLVQSAARPVIERMSLDQSEIKSR